jgi:hypothetical protein
MRRYSDFQTNVAISKTCQSAVPALWKLALLWNHNTVTFLLFALSQTQYRESLGGTARCQFPRKSPVGFNTHQNR